MLSYKDLREFHEGLLEITGYLNHRIDMNHDVLDIIKVFFHLSMNALCNLMSICEGLISIDGDLCINIDLIAEHSGMKHI